MKAKKAAFIPILLAFIPLITGLPPCFSAGLAWWLGFGVLGFGLSGAFYYLADSIEKLRVYLGQDALVIDYRLAKLLIPFGIIKEASVIDKLGSMVRVGGMTLPGLLDVGYYYEDKLGKIRAFIHRKTGLLLIILKNDAKLLISPGSPERLQEQLKPYIGRGPESPVKVNSRDKAYLASSLIVLLGLIILTFHVYPQLPQQVPVHYSENWVPDKYGSKQDLLHSLFFLLFLDLFFILVSWRISLGVPGMTLLALPVTAGLSLIASSMVLLPLCVA